MYTHIHRHTNTGPPSTVDFAGVVWKMAPLTRSTEEVGPALEVMKVHHHDEAQRALDGYARGKVEILGLQHHRRHRCCVAVAVVKTAEQE